MGQRICKFCHHWVGLDESSSGLCNIYDREVLATHSCMLYVDRTTTRDRKNGFGAVRKLREMLERRAQEETDAEKERRRQEYGDDTDRIIY